MSQDQSFAEVKGAPAIEHQKKLAREKKAQSKAPKKSKQFFTVKDGKVLSITVKPNGAYSTYVGTKAKMEKKSKGSYETQVKLWKKDNLWVAEEDFNDTCQLYVEELQKG